MMLLYGLFILIIVPILFLIVDGILLWVGIKVVGFIFGG